MILMLLVQMGKLRFDKVKLFFDIHYRKVSILFSDGVQLQVLLLSLYSNFKCFTQNIYHDNIKTCTRVCDKFVYKAFLCFCTIRGVNINSL